MALVAIALDDALALFAGAARAAVAVDAVCWTAALVRWVAADDAGLEHELSRC
ncbi:MAG TPA: hypothetical protein VIC06_14565 [Solirubrobacteraceae bacterium]